MDVQTGAMASLLPKLKELLLKDEYKLHTSRREDVEYLSREMESLHVVLLKVAEVPRDQLDAQVKLWARDVRKLSYKMEVVVEELLQTADSEGFKGLIEKMGSLLNKGKTRRQIFTSAIKDIRAQVQEISHRGQRYRVSDVISNRATVMGIDPRLMVLYTEVTELVGIGVKREELMMLLSDEDNVLNKKVKVVSVVGFGGLGKTTLVKAVYDMIKGDFDYRAFVPAGQNADVKKVLMDIILDLSMYGSQLPILDEHQLIEKLVELLKNKRYLIVIDDIWNERLWGRIKYAFSNKDNLGSRIITTTRIASVSKACCSSANDSVYQMEPLSNDDSERLLYKRIFDFESGCPHELAQVSSDILKKCGGVPLAIITVSSMLTSGQRIRSQDEWHALLGTIGCGVIEDPSWQEMLRILSFSYHDLPPHLKTCLLYMSTFPGAHPIIRDRLVKKLVAEVIVTQETKLFGSSDKNEAKLSRELSLEEAASEYLDELVNRNVIHTMQCNNNGEVISYHIHHMMHDLLKAIAIDENFAASLDDKDISRAHGKNFRHLSIDCSDSEKPIDLSSMAFDGGVQPLTVFGHAKRFLLRHFKGTRSSMAFDGGGIHSTQSLRKHIKGIRVLDLEGCNNIARADVEYICSMIKLKHLCLAKTQITILPPQIGKLQYLETLDVRGTQISELPPQIGKLQYLETLDVRGTQISELPPQIGKLQHLKTLDARKSRVKEIPNQVGRLTGLVHLLIGHNKSCKGVKLPDGIGNMTSLQQLCTIDLRKCSASSLKELGALPDLTEIEIVSSDRREYTRMNDNLLSSLEQSTKLRSLVVHSDFRLSTLQSSSAYKYLNCRKGLTVARSLKVPFDIAGQHFLGMLDIRVCKLEEGDLKILRELPRLQSLTVRLEVLPTEMIRISCEGFAELESFYVDCQMPRVIFEEGAMPKLENFGLQLYAGSASKEHHMGINHLLSLQVFVLQYSKWYATNKGVREMTDAVKTEVKKHQNKITVCIVEEDIDGTCGIKTEIFQEKNPICSRMTEIQEEDEHSDGTGYFLNGSDTQEGGLHQSSCAIASCSGTNEIEEVVD